MIDNKKKVTWAGDLISDNGRAVSYLSLIIQQAALIVNIKVVQGGCHDSRI